MSESVNVQMKKDPTAVVHWNEYEALRDHLTRQIDVVVTNIHENVRVIDLELKEAKETAATTQYTMTAIHRSITDLTRVVTTLQATVDLQNNQQQNAEEEEGDASIHGDNHGHFDDDAAAPAAHPASRGNGVRGNGDRGNGGRGAAIPHGRGFAAFGARPNFANPEVQQEDGLGKPKFSLPKFEGSNDVEEYLIWEMKIEKLWRLHEYTEDRKIKLASSEFDGYALRWWDNLVRTRQEEGDPPIITWRTMKQLMRDRFIPRNYIRSLYDKLQNLKQGTKSVDDYYQEMELIMQRARVREESEQTLQRFLSGLTYNIKRIVRHHQYHDMNDLLHHAREAEAQLAEEAKYKARSSPASGRFTPRPAGSVPPQSTNSGFRASSSNRSDTVV